MNIEQFQNIVKNEVDCIYKNFWDKNMESELPIVKIIRKHRTKKD